MKNEEKLTKGCEKDHSPPLESIWPFSLVSIYIYRGVYISPLRWTYISTTLYIYPRQTRHFYSLNLKTSKYNETVKLFINTTPRLGYEHLREL